MDIEKIKEDLSICYLKAISAINGIALEEYRHDEDSTDVVIKKIVMREDGWPFNSQIRVQLKATSSESQYAISADAVTYKLKVKNYNDLCMLSVTPVILALLVLPSSEEEWVNWSEEDVRMKGKMYWLSLQGHETSENTATVSVKIPKSHVLNTSSVEGLLEKVAREELL